MPFFNKTDWSTVWRTSDVQHDMQTIWGVVDRKKIELSQATDSKLGQRSSYIGIVGSSRGSQGSNNVGMLSQSHLTVRTQRNTIPIR